MAYRNYSTAVSHIVDSTGQGDFTTIASALTAAVSGQTIFIRPGTYTENLTLKAGVNLTAYECDALTPNVTIVGKCTATFVGTCTISGIRLQTNSDFLLAVTGSSATIVKLELCYLNCTNNTGISHTSSTVASEVQLIKCYGDLGTTGIGLYASSSAGFIRMKFCNFTNSGSSLTASTLSGGGAIIIHYCYLEFVIADSGTGAGLQIFYTFFNTGAFNTTVISRASTLATGGSIDFCYIDGGTASAITLGTGAVLFARNNTIFTSNTNAITETGASTLKYSELLFASTSSKINVTTQTIIDSSCFQKVVVQTFTGHGTYTYTPTAGMKYCTIEVVGAGGGGGGVGATDNTHYALGGGGGGGGYARKTVTSATIGTSQTVTIGQGGAGGTGNAAGTGGGTSSVGAIVSATGGNGGGNAGSGTASAGSGGVGSSGDININGNGGGVGSGVANVTISSGFGGGSYFGGGAGMSGVATGALNGGAGQNYGGGGGGGSTTNSGASTANGGAGADGVVIITEYL